MEHESHWEGGTQLQSPPVEHRDSEFWGEQPEQNGVKYAAGKRPSQSSPGLPHLTDGNTEAQRGGGPSGHLNLGLLAPRQVLSTRPGCLPSFLPHSFPTLCTRHPYQALGTRHTSIFSPFVWQLFIEHLLHSRAKPGQNTSKVYTPGILTRQIHKDECRRELAWL